MHDPQGQSNAEGDAVNDQNEFMTVGWFEAGVIWTLLAIAAGGLIGALAFALAHFI